MTINILFAAKAERWDGYEKPLNDALRKALPGRDFTLATDVPPAEVDYIV